MDTDMTTVANAIYLSNAMVLFLCVGGMIVLFKKWNGRRARIYLGVALLLWAFPYIVAVARHLALVPSLHYAHILCPLVATGFVFFSLILLPYPLELVNPGWLTLPRLLRRISPALAVLVLMWVAWWIKPLCLIGSHDYLRHFFSFSVWTRTLMVAVPFVYILWTADEVLKVDRRWKSWSAERGVSTPKATAWLQGYFFGMFILCISYVFVIFSNTPLSFLAYDIITIVFLSFLVYKAIFTDSVYPESFYCCSSDGGFRNDDIDSAFVSRIPEYKHIVEEWFEREHPYLDSHFKLENVKDVVPLNRTYISRIFNEGFGLGFSDYIRNLRMQEARRLLEEEPDTGIGEIAERCGFSTHSSFHRSFMQNNEGLTPGEYRQHMLTRNKERK